MQALLLVCLQLEEADTIFEFLQHDQNTQWQPWKRCVSQLLEYPKMRKRSRTVQLIPTLDSVRHVMLPMPCYSVQKVSR